MARVPPRKPDWLSPGYGTLTAAPLQPLDNTARVLEFPPGPAGPHRARSSASSEPAAGPAPAWGAPPHSSSSSLDALRASTLSPEPAYKSVLGRLSQAAAASSGLPPQASGAAEPPAAAAPAAGVRPALRQLPRSLSLLPPADGPASQPLQPQAPLQPREPPAGQVATVPRQPQQPAPAVPDLQLQQQLKDRIERAKAEIKQQLSPLFRVSQALLLAQQGPAEAAEALERVAAGAEGQNLGSGLGLLSLRAGSAASEVQGPGQPQQLHGAEEPWLRPGSGGSGAACSPLPAAGPAVRDNPLFEQQQKQHFGISAEAEGRQPGSLLGVGDVDSLVLSARAAVSRAQSAIADLSSPPRHSYPSPVPASAIAAVEPAPAVAANSGAAEPAEPAAQQRQQQQPLVAAPLAGAPAAALPLALSPGHPAGVVEQQQSHQQQQQHQQALVPVAAPAPDLEGRIAQLRQRAELVIRHECDKLLDSVHTLFDDFLLSVQEHGLLVRVSVAGPPSPRATAAAGPAGAWPHARDAPPPAAALRTEAAVQAAEQRAPGTASARSSQCLEEEEAPLGSSAEGSAAEGSPVESAAAASEEDAGPPPPAAAAISFEFPQGRQPPLAAAAAAPRGFGFRAPANSRLLQQAERAPGFGFGSPIRLSASQRPSPVKASAAAIAHASPARALGAQRQQLFAALVGESATPQARLGPAATPGSFLSARSSLNGSPLQRHQPSASRLVQRSGAGGGAAAAAAAGPPSGRSLSGRGGLAAAGSPAGSLGQGYYSPAAPEGPSGSSSSAQRRDLDSIVSSIRRLAAETRLKQGALLAPAGSRLLQPASAAGSGSSLLGVAGQTPKPGLRPALQTPGVSPSSTAAHTALSRFSAAKGVGGGGGGGSSSTLGSIRAAWPQRR